jgi:prepilin signal peptidase PulO-like enzyme (type II secretory pathway)
MHMLIVIGLIGLIVGSFLNVVILRLQAGKQFVEGRSECPHCKHSLGVFELIPVISWLILRGKCRHCKKPIGIQYPLVELATAALFVVSYMQFQFITVADVIMFIMWLYVVASMIVLAVYDIRWYLLPDKVLLPLIIPAGAMALGSAIIGGSLQPIIGPILAAVLFGGFFYGLAAISNGKWMGGGDIKLAFVMGLLLGLQKTAVAMFIAFNSAAIIGILLIALRLRKRKDYIPFGPFLIGGTIVAYLYGTTIIQWYVNASSLDILFI